MRVGVAPNKRAKLPAPPLLSLCVVTHLTDEPYHKERRGVVSLCLETMLRGAGNDYELIIWDNGSVPSFRDEIKRKFKPAVFVESENQGIYTARKNMCEIARGRYVNFTDDDILYHPRWFFKQREVMETFPNCAVVSGSAINYEFHRDFTPAWDFSVGPGVQSWTGNNLIPAQWEKDFSLSIGKGDFTSSRIFTELLLEYRGVKAWGHGHHMQMLCPREIIQPFLKPSKRLMDDCDIADEISTAGYLQLTTFERTAVHIGNVIDPSILRIMREMDIDKHCQ